MENSFRIPLIDMLVSSHFVKKNMKNDKIKMPSSILGHHVMTQMITIVCESSYNTVNPPKLKYNYGN